MLEIVEKYQTIGGEAPLAGDPVYIIRFSHCNLDCSYCDTDYNDEVNYTQSPEELACEIIELAWDYKGIKIMLTGGEPLLENRYEEILKLIALCPDTNFFIETNGSLKLRDFPLENCHYVCDWKSPSANVETQFERENLISLRSSHDYIKFVVSREDLIWLQMSINQIKEINETLPIYLSPQWGKIEFKELADFIVQNKLNVSLSLQIHKIIWPPDLRGV